MFTSKYPLANNRDIVSEKSAPHIEDASAAAATPAPTQRFILESGLAAQFAAIIEPTIIDVGFRLVRVSILGKEGKTVQIMAERPDGTISIDDCESISKQISPVLDVNEVLAGAYRLEVSSPGIDRPLVRPSDFEDWQGYEAKVELKEAVDGRRRFKGTLDGFHNGEVLMECDVEGAGRKLLGFPVHMVSDAKLVLTDDLIREEAKQKSLSVAQLRTQLRNNYRRLSALLPENNSPMAEKTNKDNGKAAEVNQ